MRALQAVIVGSEYVHLAGHPGWGEVRQVLAALLLLVDLALVAIVAAVSRLRTATKTRTKDKKQTENHTLQPGPAPADPAGADRRFGAASAGEQRKLSYQFLRTSVVIKAAITMMRDTVIVIIW